MKAKDGSNSEESERNVQGANEAWTEPEGCSDGSESFRAYEEGKGRSTRSKYNKLAEFFGWEVW